VVIGKFDKTFVKLESTLGEMRNLVSQADDSRVATITDLDRTKILLNQLIDKLADLKKYDPGFLVKPITAHEQKTYNVNNLTVITPVAISIVLLLTTMLLTAVSVILERTQGVSYRISLSTTDKISWFGGKILGQMFFAFLESLLIILVAVLFFGVSFNGSFYELFIALFIISACFISIGLVITTFTETQSTAILLALLIMVPLIFLSGAIFPLEFMPKTISTISGYLPLTISINLLNAIIVKGSTIALYGQQLTILIFTTIVLLAYSIWRNRV
ncbi:MAG: ABC transporter permease, partial [Candidatus Diapherotrites archaeon]|nr:ABC transporter permease [Candidatus Diapherotrites archaeon]